ncbi:MAG: glycosyltransferase family 4 protein [Gammaproteobacteria bacterium]|nr:glycosyltransferase family 4 protein [Gammaproteobacteria bacterium]
MVDWSLLVFALVCAAAMTWVVRQIALRNRLLDIPVDRSAHRTPTPVGGGVAIVIPFYLMAGYYFGQGLIPPNEFIALLSGIAVAAVGLADDVTQLSIRWRLPVQFAAAIWAVWWLGDVSVIPIIGWNLAFPPLLYILTVLALVWLLNLYNFMDGIDGLASTEASFVTLMTCLIVLNSSDQVVTLLSALLCAATIGFLLWNWPPARIFLGDTGSSFLGYCLGLLALFSMQHGSMNLWAWLLLLGFFVVDATYTLIQRIRDGRRWYVGHDTHAYQHAAKRFKSHRKVTLGILLINLLWLAPLAWLANLFPPLGLLITVVGLAPLVFLVKYFGAGRPHSIDIESA